MKHEKLEKLMRELYPQIADQHLSLMDVYKEQEEEKARLQQEINRYKKHSDAVIKEAKKEFDETLKKEKDGHLRIQEEFQEKIQQQEKMLKAKIIAGCDTGKKAAIKLKDCALRV